MKMELENMARFLHMAVDYAKEIGFKGQFLIEPKPKEPTKHQYDSDAAACYAFLKEFDLLPYFKLNIETNHATLAGHTIQHELRFARDHGILGSVDANQGDEMLGWDTDQFPTNLYTTTLMMYEVLKNGGLHSGGLNFDAKVRRGSLQGRGHRDSAHRGHGLLRPGRRRRRAHDRRTRRSTSCWTSATRAGGRASAPPSAAARRASRASRRPCSTRPRPT